MVLAKLRGKGGGGGWTLPCNGVSTINIYTCITTCIYHYKLEPYSISCGLESCVSFVDKR